MTSRQGTETLAEDRLFEEFGQYVKDRNISINPLISPHRFPRRGLGIRTNGSIPPKTKLMQVPTSAILKWSDVPKDFMHCPPPPAQDGSARVHSRLAAYLAFGDERELRENYGPWMATWPRLEDFRSGMPGLWPQSCSKIYSPRTLRVNGGQLVNGVKGAKKRKVSKAQDEDKGFAVLPPGITGKWTTIGSDGSGLKAEGTLASQQRKYEGDLEAAARFFPALRDRKSPEYQRFTWTWCCVNTRCFYYWRTWGKKPPAPPDDRDEAMAMCPGMDFFNHTADDDGGLCCTVDYNELGFTVLSPIARVMAGDELFISYGAHREEDLWTEYGFMLGDENNRWDSVKIDAVIFSDVKMGKDNRSRLKDAGYHGNYTLSKDGVCWRTETAARLLVMETEQWDRFVKGTYADDHGTEEEEMIKNVVYELVSGWIVKVQQEAENSITGLRSMATVEAMNCFIDDGDGGEEEWGETARARLDMCLRRWQQIWELCNKALNTVKEG